MEESHTLHFDYRWNLPDCCRCLLHRFLVVRTDSECANKAFWLDIEGALDEMTVVLSYSIVYLAEKLGVEFGND